MTKKKKSTAIEKNNVKKTSNVAVKKINVNFEDEIIFILDQIEDCKENRVLVSIPSGSDLLVSTVSLELLAEAADKKGRKIVVVTDDDSGKSLARSVGITVRGSENSVDDMAWKEADIAAENREEEVKVRREKAGEIDETELIPMDSPMLSSKASENGEPGVSPTPSLKASENKEKPVVMDDPAVNQLSSVKKVQVGDFEMMVDSSPTGIEKEAEGMGEQIKAEVLKPTSKSLGGSGFIGRDFSNFKIQGLDKKEKDEIERDIKPLDVIKPKTEVKPYPLLPKSKKKLDLSFIKNFFAGKSKKKMIAIISVVVLLVLATSTYAASRYLPEVIVTLEVDSISVEYIGEIIADINEDGIDEKEFVIPAKTEEVEKNGSDTAGTTGIEYEGEKATGSVIVWNRNIQEEVVLTAGTIISNGGLNFVLQSTVVLEAIDPVTLPATSGESDIVAQEIGDEYNVASGTQFSVTGHNLGDISAACVNAFTGGSEEELKVVAQADIDGIVKALTKTLGTEAENELNGKTDNSRWTIAEESIEHELDGNAISSAPAGAEANSVDVSIKTVSRALYYDKNKFNELVEILLLEDFDGQIDDIEISDNVEQTITVKSYDLDTGTVTISVEVSGYVMPQLNDDQITKSLSGKSWTDSIKYLEDMDYVSDEYDIEYLPTWMPEILWMMPVNKDRITVKVKNITPEDKAGGLRIMDPSEVEDTESTE